MLKNVKLDGKGKMAIFTKKKNWDYFVIKRSTSAKGFLVQENTLMTVCAKLGFSKMQAEASG